MRKTNEFILATTTYMEKLKMFVPIVDRVHGKHHPEFHEVKRIFENMETKVMQKDYALDEAFNALKNITDNYKVPSDVCESYEAVYNMLEILHKAYESKV